MPKQETKDKIFAKTNDYLDRFNNLLVCDVKDLPANNVHRIRKELRDSKSEVLCGKGVIIIFNYVNRLLLQKPSIYT